jgi:phosphotransferase system HPr-like phosphotransfer protein
MSKTVINAKIVSPWGLCQEIAAKLSLVAQKYPTHIIKVKLNDDEIDGTSLLALLTLAAGTGKILSISVEGPDSSKCAMDYKSEIESAEWIKYYMIRDVKHYYVNGKRYSALNFFEKLITMYRDELNVLAKKYSPGYVISEIVNKIRSCQEIAKSVGTKDSVFLGYKDNKAFSNLKPNIGQFDFNLFYERMEEFFGITSEP